MKVRTLLFLGIIICVLAQEAIVPQQPRDYGIEFVQYLGKNASVIPSKPQFTQCNWAVGQVWAGTYPGRETSPSQPSREKVTFRIESNTVMTELSESAVLKVAYLFQEQGLVAVVRDLKASPPDKACHGKAAFATYYLVWSADCESFTLHTKEDYCGRRLILYNEMTLKLVRNDTLCKFTQGETWRGYYPDHELLVGRLANFYFGVGTDIVEESSAGTIRAQWAFKPGSNRQLLVRDLGGNCISTNLVCSPGNPAEYMVSWAEGCESITLQKVDDICRSRVERYDELKLVRTNRKDQCTFKEGETWTGAFAGEDSMAGKIARFNFGAGMRVTLSSLYGYTEAFWFFDKYGDLHVRDVESKPTALACNTKILGKYSITWGKNCTEAMLSSVRDDCLSRHSVFDGLVVAKTNKAKKEPPMVVNFNFDGLIPETRCCKPGYTVAN